MPKSYNLRVIKERTFKVKYVVPETDEERAEIEKIIAEVETETIDPSLLKVSEPGQLPED